MQYKKNAKFKKRARVYKTRKDFVFSCKNKIVKIHKSKSKKSCRK